MSEHNDKGLGANDRNFKAPRVQVKKYDAGGKTAEIRSVEPLVDSGDAPTIEIPALQMKYDPMSQNVRAFSMEESRELHAAMDKATEEANRKRAEAGLGPLVIGGGAPKALRERASRADEIITPPPVKKTVKRSKEVNYDPILQKEAIWTVEESDKLRAEMDKAMAPKSGIDKLASKVEGWIKGVFGKK